MNSTPRRSPSTLLAAGALVLAASLGIRHAFGLFLQPMSLANGWGREAFAFALALQNLIWGAAQPFVGMLADRYGAGKAILGGALLYAIGLAWMAAAHTPGELALSAGLLIGLGLSGTSFSVVFGVISRATPPAKRSQAMGVASAVGSLGQFALLPGSVVLLAYIGWPTTLLALAALALLTAPLAALLAEPGATGGAGREMSAGQALRAAGRHRGFWLLSFGFFVCGFQVVFIAIHLPAFLVDKQLPASVGATTLALVGLFNVAGTYLAGLAGGKYRKPWLLAFIYLARAGAIATFVWLPVSAGSAYAFGVAMGLLWLSTVPLTNGVVISIFGVRNMSMLGGIVFFFHQVGAFLGGWLGGYLYDRTGSYDAVWLIAIGLSLTAALLNLPIREEAVPQPGQAAQTA